MGEICVIRCKTKFENTWPNILAEKLANLASVEVITQSEYRVVYGVVVREFSDLTIDPNLYLPTCVKYDGGFFFVVGCRYNDSWLIRITSNETIDMNKNRIVHTKIKEFFKEMNATDGV